MGLLPFFPSLRFVSASPSLLGTGGMGRRRPIPAPSPPTGPTDGPASPQGRGREKDPNKKEEGRMGMTERQSANIYIRTFKPKMTCQGRNKT